MSLERRAARRVICIPLLFAWSLGAAQSPAPAFGGHTKYRLTHAENPDDSLLRDLSGSSASDLGFDARLNLAWGSGNWDLRAQAQVAVFHGDTLASTRDVGGDLQIFFPRLPEDGRRLLDLTHIVTDSGRRAALARVDRFSAGYTADRAVVRFGRQAVTWGNGLLFNTVMDIFNPFDPAAIDKEYKPGDDMLYGQYLRGNGDDLQAVAVFRRDPLSGNLKADHSSVAVKYHGLVGGGELEILAARHFGETLIGVGGSRDVGGALWRGDMVATATDWGDAVICAVTSVSRSFVWAGRNVTGAVEYYFSGFGQRRGRYSPLQLAANPALTERLARGELFNPGRHYVGFSAAIEVTPLFVLSPNVFVNVEDPSALIQVTAAFDVGTDVSLLAALNVPTGGPGTEYGGIDSGVPGRRLAAGPGLFVQLAWYF